MRLVISSLAISILAVSLLNAVAAENAATAKLKSIASEDLSTSAPANWKVGKGAWKIADGAWQGAELAADKHGAVARTNLAFSDAVIEFDFRLDGARGISLSINDPKGHNSRLAIRPSGFTVTKDDHDHEGPDQRVVLADEKRELTPGKWYHARLELAGPKIMAQIGEGSNLGKAVGGEHEQIAVPKSNIGFTVAGQTASFKNLRVNVPAGN